MLVTIALSANVACGVAELRPTPTHLPTPGPAPTALAPFVPKAVPTIPDVLPTRGATPTAWPGARPARSRAVRMIRQVWLLEAPRADAPRVLPVGAIAPGVDAMAVEEAEGWVRIDPGPFTGWAPVDTVEFLP